MNLECLSNKGPSINYVGLGGGGGGGGQASYTF